MSWEVDPDIRRARTPPPELYTSAEVFDRIVDRVFRSAWLMTPALVGEEIGLALPFELLPGVLRAPLALVRGNDGIVRCLSNVCTHRANLVIDAPGCLRALRCRYHGRRFSLDGRFVSMPEFEGAEDFPSPADDLPVVASARLGPIPFASVAPAKSFEEVVRPIRERLAFLPWSQLRLDGERTYEVAANWALYVENYLEGFHVPFVHPGLAQELDYASYRTELFDQVSLQIGTAKRDDAAFALPDGHPDGRSNVAAYYFYVFPTTMVNVYPWGVSMNAIEPRSIDRTAIKYATWVWDESRRGVGAGGDLEKVEMEDEAVVESVARGVRSPLYRGGRYSPTREQGVHHFHRLVTAALAD
jgi:choline monooxygenase